MGLLDLFKKKEEVKDTQYDINFNNDEQFVSAFEDTNIDSSKDNSERFKDEFQVDDVFTITGRGTVVTGRVNFGKFYVGDNIIVNNKPSKIVGIEMFRKTIDSVSEGENAGLLLSDISRDEVSQGCIIYKAE